MEGNRGSGKGQDLLRIIKEGSGSSVLIESILGSPERVRCLSCQFNKSLLSFLSTPCDTGTRMPPEYPFANAYEHGPSIPRTNENEWVCGKRWRRRGVPGIFKASFKMLL
ncbi:hypothetical protein ALC60_00605 [Trachymyrmex zeteki]|uniref:Uncharacterized protein n=1 Tax=Mycetomoellerius zeteki TaxID=64791 RepID=A0A151XIU4_9HYME|nr:hypothetical protein ALC60_00605 [Trachymyrmex zeteki]